MTSRDPASCRLPTEYGEFTATAHRDREGREHLALSMGDLGDGVDVLVRVHSECLTGEALGSLRCDCGEQLQQALAAIASEGRGVLVYLRQEGRGIGLFDKVRAYALQDQGADTVDANLRLGLAADARNYGAAVTILGQMGVRSVRLMTNNPLKVRALTEAGIAVRRIPSAAAVHPGNASYLRTKRLRMGHLLGRLRLTSRS